MLIQLKRNLFQKLKENGNIKNKINHMFVKIYLKTINKRKYKIVKNGLKIEYQVG